MHESSISAQWTFYRLWAIEPQLAQHAWPAFAVIAAYMHKWPTKHLLWQHPVVMHGLVHSTSKFWSPSLIPYGIRGFRCKDVSSQKCVYMTKATCVLQFGSHGIWRKSWRLVSSIDSTWSKEQLRGCSFPLHVGLLSILPLPEVGGPASFSITSQQLMYQLTLLAQFCSPRFPLL